MTQAPTFDVTRDYADVLGEPGVKFMQSGCYYNVAGEFVRNAPEEHMRGAPAPVLDARARKAQAMIEQARQAAAKEQRERDALERANANMSNTLGGQVPSQPSGLVDAQRENAAAARAEDEAE